MPLEFETTLPLLIECEIKRCGPHKHELQSIVTRGLQGWFSHLFEVVIPTLITRLSWIKSKT